MIPIYRCHLAHHLSRNPELADRAREIDWDPVVADEAHKMSARVWSDEGSFAKVAREDDHSRLEPFASRGVFACRAARAVLRRTPGR